MTAATTWESYWSWVLQLLLTLSFPALHQLYPRTFLFLCFTDKGFGTTLFKRTAFLCLAHYFDSFAGDGAASARMPFAQLRGPLFESGSSSNFQL